MQIRTGLLFFLFVVLQKMEACFCFALFYDSKALHRFAFIICLIMKHRHSYILILLCALFLYAGHCQAQILQSGNPVSFDEKVKLKSNRPAWMEDSVWQRISGCIFKITGLSRLRGLNAGQKQQDMNFSDKKTVSKVFAAQSQECAKRFHPAFFAESADLNIETTVQSRLHASGKRNVFLFFQLKLPLVCETHTPLPSGSGYKARRFDDFSSEAMDVKVKGQISRRIFPGMQTGYFSKKAGAVPETLHSNAFDSVVKAIYAPWAYTNLPAAGKTADVDFNSVPLKLQAQKLVKDDFCTQKQIFFSTGAPDWGMLLTELNVQFGSCRFYYSSSEEETCQGDPLSGVFSQIFTGIAFPEFMATLAQNIRFAGDNLNQSNMTDLCGKYSMVRLWIQEDPEAYKRTMSELYFNGRTKLFDGTILNVSGHIVAVINSSAGFDKDDKQNWGLYTEMPNRTDMLLMLALADHFHWKLGSSQPYSNDEHYENNGLWAGSTIGSEMRMLRAFGFEVEKYGDNLIGLNKDNEMQLKTAIASGRPVLLLVNSYQLNTVAFAVLDRPEPGLFQKNTFGTHWISAAGVVGGHNIVFWEYGAYNAASEDFWKTVCGGVVVSYKAGVKKV